MKDPLEQNDFVACLASMAAGLNVPAAPDQRTNQQLVAKMERRSKRSTASSFPKSWSKRTMQRVMTVAAALIVMVGVVSFSAFRTGSSGAVFAAMIERVNAIRTVSFNLRAEFKDADDANIESTFTVAYPWTRVTATVDGEKVVGISNAEQQKQLILFESLKRAQLRDMKGASKIFAESNIVERLRNLRKEEAEYLGKEQLDSVDLHKYRQQNKGDWYTIWIDPTTQLPVQVESSDPAGTFTVKYSKFEWDPSVDVSQFTLVPPAGYDVTDNTK